MRKISSHFYLKSDGTFGKHPVVELDDDGLILNVREMGEVFTEEPGLEYFPGILVAGFVASFQSDSPTDAAVIRRIARSNGVLRLEENDKLALDEYQRAWSVIKALMQEQQGMAPLGHYLLNHSNMAARLLGQTGWGLIREGANPGLLVLQNIDLRNFSLTDKSSFRIIQK